jgi:hypothetical protein
VKGRELPATTGDEAARVVRSLGAHRYVAGRLLLVHAFVFDAMEDDATDDTTEARAWAQDVLADSQVDKGSRDERLWRRATEKEIAAALTQFWSKGAIGTRARQRLSNLLASHQIAIDDGEPFDEAREDDMFPVLIDAGWELLALAAFDPERHRGAIDAFEDFAIAKFDEESVTDPSPYLHELPALGAAELLRGTDDAGDLKEPFVVYCEGPDAYHDYLLRGVVRAAKLEA